MLKGYDVALDLVVDSMHCIALGVIRTLFKLILMPGKKWSLSVKDRSELDDALCCVEYPHDCGRAMRSIEAHFKLFKGHTST